MKNILKELRKHTPFTLFGAATGIILMLVFYNIPNQVSHNVFYTLHPMHVILSALATASMYKIYAKKVNPLALLGVAIAYYNPRTKFPHAGHVLLSTWASLFHILMASSGSVRLTLVLVIFVFLFIAVLIPCCLSDIIFPLLIVKRRKDNG